MCFLGVRMYVCIIFELKQLTKWLSFVFLLIENRRKLLQSLVNQKKTTTKKCLDVNEELTEKLLIFPVKTAWGVNGAWPRAYSQHELEVGHLAFHG